MKTEINIFINVFLAAAAGTTIAQTLISPLVKNLLAEFFENRKRIKNRKIEIADSIRSLIIEGKNKIWRSRYREPEHFTYVIEESSQLNSKLPKQLKKLRESWDKQVGDDRDLSRRISPNAKTRNEDKMKKREKKLKELHKNIKSTIDKYR